MGTDTTFVVVNFNGSQYLEGCLSAIASQGSEAHIIVVDNGSADDSKAIIEQQFPRVRLIENAENVGFAGAANQGAQAANSRYLAFVNTDVVLSPGWLKAILSVFADSDDAACVGSRLLNKDGDKLDFDGGTVNFYGFGQQVRFGSPLDPEGVGALLAAPWIHNRPHPGADEALKPVEETSFACAGAMVVDREVFLRVRGFDESFFAYFEDVDLGYRLWLSGCRVLITREAVGYHVHHGTAAEFLSDAALTFLAEKNALALVIKNFEEKNLARLLPASLFMTAARLVPRAKDALPSENAVYDAAKSGVRDMLDVLNALGDEVSLPTSALSGPLATLHVAANLDCILAKRAECQKLRKRGDDEILNRFPGFFFPSFFNSRYFDVEKTLVQSLGLSKVLGEEHPGPLVEAQMKSLQARLYEELDRLGIARTADQKHIQGLEATLEDRSAEVRRLQDALAERQKEVTDAIAAAQAKEDIVRDASAAIEERDERLGRAEASISEKDELVKRFEELAESRKEELIALQKQVEELLKRIESSFGYRTYIGLKKLASLLSPSGRGDE
ncbi:MAG: glycosyltransferase [Candidatus Coatesbacteria bacterium]|nr:glycosyltransferase [Candidatus Coatesbacteria bacterium]